MSTKRSWSTIDKSGWGEGPWRHEPDKQHWVDEATGLDCLIVRNDYSGILCGYVGVPKSHPLFGVAWDKFDDVDVHGGITFADGCNPSPHGEAHGICHTAPEGAEVWWVGFDCGHCFDLMPGFIAHLGTIADELAKIKAPLHELARMFKIRHGEQYRSIAYVEIECERLARQLAERRS